MLIGLSATLLAQYTEWRRINLVLKAHANNGFGQPVQQGIALTINGRSVTVPAGITVAAALMIEGMNARISVSGEPRSPLCAMGICMECCATVNGIPHVRTCLVTVEPGMQVTTG